MKKLQFSAKEKMKVDNFNLALAINRWNLKLLGLWPLDTDFSNLLFSINFIIIIIFTFPSAIQLFATATNWNSIITQIIRTILFILLMMRIIFIKVQSKNLRIILDSMITDWKNYCSLPEQYQRIMDYYAKRSRLFTVINITFTMLSVIGYASTPIMNTWLNNLPWNQTSRYLPNEGFYPFPIQSSPTFELLYLMQTYTLFLSGMAMSAIDCFLYIIVFHACGQFDLLAAILQRYGRFYEHNCRHTYSLVCTCLSCIVKRHVHIINYMDMAERSFNLFILIQLFGNCFELAIEGYLFYTFYRSHNINGIITCIIYLITLAYSIFIYCWIGNCIIEKSDNIRIVTYNLEWYSFPNKYALPIILIMARARKPCKITAGRFSTMSFSYCKT
ncbi:OrUA2PC, partial [Eciton burchellii]